MKYIFRDGDFYFAGFDEDWPTWMTDINGAKRYNTKEELNIEKEKIPAGILKNTKIIEGEWK